MTHPLMVKYEGRLPFEWFKNFKNKFSGCGASYRDCLKKECKDISEGAVHELWTESIRCKHCIRSFSLDDKWEPVCALAMLEVVNLLQKEGTMVGDELVLARARLRDTDSDVLPKDVVRCCQKKKHEFE